MTYKVKEEKIVLKYNNLNSHTVSDNTFSSDERMSQLPFFWGGGNKEKQFVDHTD